MTRVVLVVAGLGALAEPAAAQTYSSSADYSQTTDPNGVWAYGSLPAAGPGYVPNAATALTVFDTTSIVQTGLQAWTTAGGVGVPSAAYNYSGSDLSRSDSIFRPGRMVVHAGPSLAGAVQFTAPAAGTYSLNVHFENRTTNRGWPVYVFQGAALLDTATFTDGLQGGGHDYMNPALVLAAGETVTFAAGPRFDGDFNSTVTQVDAVLTPVPEPAAVLAAAVGLGVARRRRHPIGR